MIRSRFKFYFHLEMIYLTTYILFFIVILGKYQKKNEMILQPNLSL